MVVVTNQSAIGRGIITPEQYAAVDAEMDRQLAAVGIMVDATYHCPDQPPAGETRLDPAANRKPGAGMLRRGALDLGLDLARSFMVGDMLTDVQAGSNAGCASFLIDRTGAIQEPIEGGTVVPSLLAASALILQESPRPLLASTSEPEITANS